MAGQAGQDTLLKQNGAAATRQGAALFNLRGKPGSLPTMHDTTQFWFASRANFFHCWRVLIMK
jgi:hypothetical protein